ncbi:MAG: Hsp20/alpha crystallin family protein [Tissierellia bacterium]|nr:Hsp20/alpha crystallin family protein [Tissierellia bacterium]MDD4439040.1 Hsp20/alpha crystallin family protein [Tissierellia bacterium]
MAGLVPYNRRNRGLVDRGFGDFRDFYNMVDDFFNDSWPSRRSFARDTFKIDVQENDSDYLIEAELPGVDREEVNIDMNEGRMTISVQREENINEENKNYVHKERRFSSMSRSLYLDGAKSTGIKAKLENGVLNIKVPKENKPDSSVKIDIE